MHAAIGCMLKSLCTSLYPYVYENVLFIFSLFYMHIYIYNVRLNFQHTTHYITYIHTYIYLYMDYEEFIL